MTKKIAKGRVLLTAALFCCLALLVIPLVGCEASVSVSTASLSEVTMCTAVDEDARPLDSTDVFSADTTEIFCSVKLSNAPSGTMVKATWTYIEGELDVTDMVLGEYELEGDGTRYLQFSLFNESVWPTGAYQVDLYLDGEPEETVTFTVE